MKEIGQLPDREGFEVSVDGDEVLITQGNDPDNLEDADVIIFHASDVGLLMELLEEAAWTAAANADALEATERPENPTCSTLPGAHSPDGTCCAEPEPEPTPYTCDNPTCCVA